MRSDLIYTPTTKMDHKDWLTFRLRGIGASETGTILGLNENYSAIQMFYDKIGEGIRYTVENIAMFHGKEQENYWANLWQYWGGDEESMIANFRDKRIIRRMQKVNAYVQNPDYDWLFVSLDRKINKHKGKDEGALELKTIGSWNANKWIGGIPPYYIIQVQTQLMVCDFDYGELFVATDGRYLELYEIEKSKELQDAVLESSYVFWEKVKKGREIQTKKYQAERTFNMRAVEELTAELHSIEPVPDGSESFEQFLKEKYKIAKSGEREGTIIELEQAKEHKALKMQIKELEEQARQRENYLKNSLKEMTDLNFGKEGRVSWRPNEKGIRIFNNRVIV